MQLERCAWRSSPPWLHNRYASLAPTPTAIPTMMPTVAPTEVSLAATSMGEAQQAVIQIEAQGTFASPAGGQVYNVAGRGSGFIIDETGIAVTNNHVVTGAAVLKVYVQGNERPVNARVLGVSECSDLAVIDLDGENYRYLTWFDGDLKAAWRCMRRAIHSASASTR
jgi:serine protease Do